MNLKLRSKRFLNEVFTKMPIFRKRSGFSFFFFVCFTIIIETINDFYAERSGYYVTTISKIMIAIDGSDEADLAFKKRSTSLNETMLNYY